MNVKIGYYYITTSMNSIFERLSNIYERLRVCEFANGGVNAQNIAAFSQILNSAIAMTDNEMRTYGVIRELQRANRDEFHAFLRKTKQQYLLLCTDGQGIAADLEISDLVNINYNKATMSFDVVNIVARPVQSVQTVQTVQSVQVSPPDSEIQSERPWKTRNNKIFENLPVGVTPEFYTKQGPKNYAARPNQELKQSRDNNGYKNNHNNHNNSNNGRGRGDRGTAYSPRLTPLHAGTHSESTNRNYYGDKKYAHMDNPPVSKYDRNAERNAERNADRNDRKFNKQKSSNNTVAVEKIELPKREKKEKKISILKPLSADMISRALAESQIIPDENKPEIRAVIRTNAATTTDSTDTSESAREKLDRISWSEGEQ